MLVGGLLAALRVLLCGRWYLHAFCGVFGGKRMIEVLRTVIGLRRTLNLYFSTSCIFEQLLLFLLWCLVIMIFLFFLLLGDFLCILCVCLGRITLLMISQILIKKIKIIAHLGFVHSGHTL